jgi:short-subunit dehydrogenase
MKPTDARVLLTGASGGIGCACALALARAGAALLLSSRSPARLAAQQRELRALVPAAQVDWHVCDLEDPRALDALAPAAGAWRANTLVHAAGVPSFGRFEALPAEHLQRVLHVDLLVPMLLTRALLPHLQRQPQAAIVHIGSALGRIGLPGFTAYCAAKFGLRGFAEALRRELAASGIAVQYLGPRSTRTAFNDARVESYNRATHTAMDAPERVAAALVRLLQSGSAERFIGVTETLAARLNALAPSLLDRGFARHRDSLPTDFAAEAAIEEIA